MEKINKLVESLLTFELKKNGSIPWYLATAYLKLNPGSSLKCCSDDVSYHIYSYNKNSDTFNCKTYIGKEVEVVGRGLAEHLTIHPEEKFYIIKN